MSLTTRVNKDKVNINKISAYDAALEEGVLYSREFTAKSALTLPGGAGDDAYGFKLPDLPDGAVYYIAAVGDVQAKLANCGSAGTTTVLIRAPGGDVATVDLINSDTDNTLKNATSVVATIDIPGGSRVALDVDAIATAAAGPLTITAKFSIRYIRDLWA